MKSNKTSVAGEESVKEEGGRQDGEEKGGGQGRSHVAHHKDLAFLL